MIRHNYRESLYEEEPEDDYMGFTVVTPFEDTIIDDLNNMEIKKEDIDWNAVSEVVDRVAFGVLDYVRDIAGGEDNTHVTETAHSDNGLDFTIDGPTANKIIETLQIRDNEEGMIVLELDSIELGRIVDKAFNGIPMDSDQMEALKDTFGVFTYLVAYPDEGSKYYKDVDKVASEDSTF